MIDPGDSGWLLTYVELADRILKGTNPEIADVSPTYLWLMVALRFLHAGATVIRNLQLVMLVAAAIFCALAAKRIGGRIAGVATAVLILGNRAAWVVCAELDPKALVFLLTSIALWALLRRSQVIAGVALGLAAATHPYGYVLLFIALLWSAATSRRRTPHLAVAALIPIALVLALSPVESHAGTQFFEGNNALATGCAGATPRVVLAMQMQRHDGSPDPAYRQIARAHPPLWRDKALAFIREYPSIAMQRFATKALLTIHHFDVHDVITAQRRHVRLSRFPAIPFGVAFVLAVAALLSRKRRELVLPALFALAMVVLLTIFIVSARQRNVLLAPLAIMGGVGVAEIVALLRARIEHGLLAFGAILIATALLGIETAPMREYDHMWRNTVWMPPADDPSPPSLFDSAIRLARAGRWREADAILATLEDYRPMRQSSAVSSVAYYRARAALATGRDPKPFLARAAVEAPGDPHVLALRATYAMDHQAARLLDELHDPMTRDYALRHAFEVTRGSGSSGPGR